MLALDHLAISAQALNDFTALPVQPGGEHALMGTHNRLLSLGPEYLEVIAVNPAAAAPQRPRWFSLDRFSGPPRLTTWICRTPDIEAMVKTFPHAGEIIDFQRGPYRWRMAVPTSGDLAYDGLFPALIEWQEGHPAAALTDRNFRLRALEITHPKAEEMQAQLQPLLADGRVTFRRGAPGLLARLVAPEGERVLT